MRISGPDADKALSSLGVARLPQARRASLRRLIDPSDDRPIDQVLVLWFPGPNSFSGENLVEIHHHGGTGVRRMLGRALALLPGLRPAEPGEFTRRAYLNGRLDLAEVEGLGDLIDAGTARSARQALLRLDGGLTDRVAAWSERLLDAQALIEADLDFAADQADVAPDMIVASGASLEQLAVELGEVLRQARLATRLRQGCVVAIVGAPNVGKSSLINLLAGREVAIVTDLPGTTRDPIEVELELDRLPVTLVDTAGLRDAHDPIEREGIRRARERSEAADLVVELFDAREPFSERRGSEQRLMVANKADLATPCAGQIAISCRTGAGIDLLLQEIVERLNIDGTEELGAVPADARGQAAIAECRQAALAASAALRLREPALAAEELRRGTAALARITGGGDDPEDVLARIFARFCIGK